jgi:hypothetical protein
LFFGLAALIVVFSVYQKIRGIMRIKKSLDTGKKEDLEKPESENEVGLIIMTAVLYFF